MLADVRHRTKALRRGKSAVACVALAVACGGAVDSGKGAPSGGGAGGIPATWIPLPSGGTSSAGGILWSTGGAGASPSTGLSGSLGGYGGAASGFCPTLNFSTGLCRGCGTVSVPGCCLPSGKCGALDIYPNCETYTQIGVTYGPTNVPTDPQTCAYSGNDAGSDASSSSDASVPQDSGTPDSTDDQGG